MAGFAYQNARATLDLLTSGQDRWRKLVWIVKRGMNHHRPGINSTTIDFSSGKLWPWLHRMIQTVTQLRTSIVKGKTRPDTRPSDASPSSWPYSPLALSPFPRHPLPCPLQPPLPPLTLLSPSHARIHLPKSKTSVFAHSKKNGLRTNGWTDGRTDGRTDGQTRM